MKLEHIALTIVSQDEIRNFYQDILGMEFVRTFNLNVKLARAVFNVDYEATVFQLKNDSYTLEIFVDPQMKQPVGFNHICISVLNRLLLIEKAAEKKYEVIRIERENSDLIFLKDMSGNMFEIKEL